MFGDRPTFFADAVIEAQVAHGVARIVLARTCPDGKAQPCATLCVSSTQMSLLVNGLGILLQQIEARVRNKGAQHRSAAPGNGGAGSA
jgi:hypothetical protein